MKVVGNSKASRAEKSHGKNLRDLNDSKKELAESLNEIFIPEVLEPKFNFEGIGFGDSFAIINGAVGYSPNDFILRDININLEHSLAIIGNNGSGKTTLVRAIMDDPAVYKSGQWNVPKKVGYIDQHYSILEADKTPFETIKERAPNLNTVEIRKYLNDFLFRKNEEVNSQIKYLSGGERARLCMAKIAINPPALLILDEITNNIDLETRNHIADVLKNYRFKFIVISHDEDFLQTIGVEQRFFTSPL